MSNAPEQLRAWILRSKLKDEDAAKVLGMTGGYLSQLLNGKRMPSLETALRIEERAGIVPRSWMLSQLSTHVDEPTQPATKRPGFARRKA